MRIHSRVNPRQRRRGLTFDAPRPPLMRSLEEQPSSLNHRLFLRKAYCTANKRPRLPPAQPSGCLCLLFQMDGGGGEATESRPARIPPPFLPPPSPSTDGRDVRRVELVVSEAAQQAGLAHAGVPDEQQAKEHVVLLGHGGGRSGFSPALRRLPSQPNAFRSRRLLVWGGGSPRGERAGGKAGAAGRGRGERRRENASNSASSITSIH